MDNTLKEGSQTGIREYNKRVILQHILRHEGISRASISHQLNISKPTVSKVVEELLTEEWIKEQSSTGKHLDTPGRKPTYLFVNKESKYLIGVDIGGTNVDIGILNLEGEIQCKTVISTQQHVEDNDLVEVIAETIEQLRESYMISSSHILAVGVGAPGITNPLQGVVYEAPSLRWQNYPLKGKMEALLSYPVYIENDVNVAVLGEYWKGVAKDKSNVVLITLGTGVGCGIMINNNIYHGKSHAAGEIGYIITEKSMMKGYQGTFQGYGFLESQVGGPSIVKRMQEKYKDKEITSAEEIFQLAIAGDTEASEIVEEVIEHLGVAIINIISIFSPQCIILGGGIARSGDWFIPKIQSMVDSYLPVQTEIIKTELPDLSIVGAAALCLKEHDLLLSK